MGTIFIMAGSLLGFVTAVLLVGFGSVSLLAGLGIWIASGPVSALLFVTLVLSLSRGMLGHGPRHYLA